MSVVLGINAFHAGASAAIVVDGVPRMAIAEERLNRVKYYAGFPRLAVQRCLSDAGLKFSDIDAVAVGRDPRANRGRKVRYALTHPARLVNLLRMRSSRAGLNDLCELIASECNVPSSQLRFTQHRVEHHVAHIASAFFASGWQSAAGFSVDGSGDFVTVMMAACEGVDIDVRHRVFVPHSLGSLYTMVCEFIGYGKYGDEGKVMGLAPLGKNTYKQIFDDMVQLTDDGFELNARYFMPLGSNQGMTITDAGEMVMHRHYSNVMRELFGQPRAPDAELSQRDRDLAFGVQHVFERAYMHLLRLLYTKAPYRRVAMAGGCVLNSVANGRMFDQNPFTRTWIQPAAGDDGLALGAALHVGRTRFNAASWTMKDASLGPEYDDATIVRALDEARVEYIKLNRSGLLRATVDELEKGKVVGWYQGRSEWGPRALGNRSILTHPGLPGMKDILNARIKRREGFRPFAPAVLAERQSEIFDQEHPSPFMLHVYNVRPGWRARLSAVTHVDGTGRLQSVTREENALYYDLIAAFDARTGIPVLLNTSFNENEPIVDTPAQAVDCFVRTRMDVLVIGPYVCWKLV